jgi:hypothetical protein
MQKNEVHRQPSAFVSVLASLLLPASGHCNDLKNYWHPCSFAKAEGGTVADDDHTLGSSSYISQSASIVIEDDKRSHSLRPFVFHTASLSALVLSVLSSAARWLPLQSKGTLFPLRSVWSLRLASLAHLSLIELWIIIQAVLDKLLKRLVIQLLLPEGIADFT